MSFNLSYINTCNKINYYLKTATNSNEAFNNIKNVNLGSSSKKIGDYNALKIIQASNFK